MPKPNPLGSVFDIVESFCPVDLSTGTNTGDWINLKNAYGALLVLHAGIGAAGETAVITFAQAKTNAGGSTKALSPVTSPTHLYKKQAATNLASTPTWADASGDVSAQTYTSGAGNLDRLVAIWIDAESLDVNNGFYYVQATIADVGATAQPASCDWIVMLAYPNSPANIVSNIQ